MLKNICEFCGIGPSWNDKSLTLQLDHINGVNTDNRLENLRILCPNCHSQTDTWCGKTKFTKPKSTPPKQYAKLFFQNTCVDCVCDISKNRTRCNKCASKINGLKQRRVIRPSMNQLLKEIEELGFSGTGRKYGVSDNAIRKWIK